MMVSSRLPRLCAMLLLLGLSPARAQDSLTLRVIPFPAVPLAARFERIEALETRMAGAPTTLPPFEIEADSSVPSLRLAAAFAPEADRGFRLALLPRESRAIAYALADWTRTGARTLLEKRLRAAIVSAYAARDFAPFWNERNASARESLARRLHAAGEDGLDLRGFAPPAAVDSSRALSPAEEFAFDESILTYVSQASGSRVDPSTISHLIGARPQTPDLSKALARLAAAGGGAGDELEACNPPHYGYRLLREKLADLRGRRISRGSDAIVEARDSLDDAVPTRRARPQPSEGATSALEAEIIANMERWRWLPRDLGEDRVEVNLPEFELAVVRGGSVVHRTRIIVGKPETPTPIFSNAIRFVIVNPAWNVPESIITKEMLPKAGGDLSGLAERGWKVRSVHGKLMVQQPPGAGNALGQLKIMFPNDFSVYMHDTPSRGLFAATRRAFSHGCMRVQNPFSLAEAILGSEGGYSEARLRSMIGDKERYVYLKTPLPVHIEYFTAFVDESGRLRQLEDLYGYSAKVRQALGLGG